MILTSTNYFIWSITLHMTVGISLEEYYKYRRELLTQDIAKSLGGDIILSKDEILANKILMYWKHKELADKTKDANYFSFSKPLLRYKRNLNESNVFKIITEMPKGALLHVHNSLLLDADYMLKLTYEDNLYICLQGDDVTLKFSTLIPTTPICKWNLLSELRKNSMNGTDLDLKLRKYYMLFTEDDVDIPDSTTMWRRLNKVIHVIYPLLLQRPLYENYFYETLNRLYNDNIIYAEIRIILNQIREPNGTAHDKMYLVKLHRDITKQFMEKHPDFLGVKLIVSASRGWDTKTLKETIDFARKFKEEMPEMFAGFDIIGHEDSGKLLKDYLPVLNEAKDMNFYFHAGETNQYGTPVDENIYDAVLLGSKRIGAALPLVKHPSLLEIVKQKDIAVECNVLSNVMLSLVQDVRNHPLATYLANNLTVVLSSDDPGPWGADPLSHDFYAVFMGVASSQHDLRLLKQLAMNSIEYSATAGVEKKRMFMVFYIKWKKFIDDVISSSKDIVFSLE